MNKEAIKFLKVLWCSVLTARETDKKGFAYLGSLRGQHNCVVS
jgi:hypothetical protein